MTTASPASQTDFEPVYHHYGPHRAGLPPLVPYFRELWHRRAFATEMSRAVLRGQKVTTFFGQAWLVLNPLLLAGIYYLLVTIIRGRHDPLYFAHLTLNLFLFTMMSTAASMGVQSVIRSGRLLINTAFPRLLIPLSTVRTAFFRFLPTVPIYLLIHAFVLRGVWHPRMLLAIYFLATTVVFAMGLTAFVAAVQVYFRDTASFLPYMLRIWMYLSPVLWMPAMLQTMWRPVQTVIQFNPMYPMLTGFTDLMQVGVVPPAYVWLASAAWALVGMVAGFGFFISREREFAVRLT